MDFILDCFGDVVIFIGVVLYFVGLGNSVFWIVMVCVVLVFGMVIFYVCVKVEFFVLEVKVGIVICVDCLLVSLVVIEIIGFVRVGVFLYWCVVVLLIVLCYLMLVGVIIVV